jgi:O-methyltransferase involved in polyketide biosynthesis
MTSMIELRGVERTLALPLRARAEEHVRPDRLFADPRAADWFARLPCDEQQDRWYTPVIGTSAAIRSHVFDQITTQFLAAHPAPTVIELGAGLSTRFYRVRQGRARWFELDLPSATALRRRLDRETDDHRFLATSITDPIWLDQLAEQPPEQVLLLAEGVLYFLDPLDVQRLFERLRDRLPGATIVLDAVGSDFSPDSLTAFARMDAPMTWLIDGTADLAALGLDPIHTVSTLDLYPQRWNAVGIEPQPVPVRSSGIIAQAIVR